VAEEQRCDVLLPTHDPQSDDGKRARAGDGAVEAAGLGYFAHVGATTSPERQTLQAGRGSLAVVRVLLVLFETAMYFRWSSVSMQAP